MVRHRDGRGETATDRRESGEDAAGDRDAVYDVVAALADVEEQTPMEFDGKVWEHVDPEVLSVLAAADRGTWRFTFEVDDRDVTITHDGRTIVDGQPYRDGVPVEDSSR